ncbi:MAG TPA: hypothetical protein ACYCC8_01375 [Candidatus Azoamicus sp.]
MKQLLFFILLILSFNAVCLNIEVKNSNELYTAFKKCKNNDTIIIHTGIYKGNFVINKKINLYSKGYVILTSNNDGNIITINSSDVKIKGIHFYNSGKSMSEKMHAFLQKVTIHI